MADKRVVFFLHPALLFALCLTLPATTMAGSGTIVGSKHDLSSGTTTEICVFCHTPHSFNNDVNRDGVNDVSVTAAGGPAMAPLWNRRLSTVNGMFTPYKSASMNQDCPDTPSPVSLACLSCHDEVGGGAVLPSGDNEMHTLVNEPNLGNSEPQCTACHPSGNLPGSWWQIGPDVSNEHPISIDYATTYNADPWFKAPPSFQRGWSTVRLFNGRVECPSCHNAHDPTNVPFLRVSNSGSGLCYTCHDK